MKIAFDLDGTLDRRALAELARILMLGGHEVHIITGVFLEAGDWQSPKEKFEKLRRWGISFERTTEVCDNEVTEVFGDGPVWATLHVLYAVDPSFGLDYRLRDLGLRKGALCEKLGIEILFDDSETYCTVAKCMAGGLTTLQVR